MKTYKLEKESCQIKYVVWDLHAYGVPILPLHYPHLIGRPVFVQFWEACASSDASKYAPERLGYEHIHVFH